MAHYIFDDIHRMGKPYVYIHPYKQQAVRHMVDNLPSGYPWVDYAIVFGSAVSPSCHYGSDIDICLVGKTAEDFNSQRLRDKSHAYDFILVDSKQDLVEKSENDFCSVYRDIWEEGVVVYAKGRDLAG